MNVERDIDILDVILGPHINNMMSGYSSRRQVVDHHAISAALYVYFKDQLFNKLDTQYQLIEDAVSKRDEYVSLYYAIKDDRVPHDPYFEWHDKSRELTDYLMEKGYAEAPNRALILDLIDLYLN